MKSKIENQFLQAIENSQKHCLFENAVFLCKRLLEVTQKEAILNQIIPFLISQNETHFLMNILKKKKTILNKYYYSVCLFKCGKNTKAIKSFNQILEIIQKNVSSKKNKETNEQIKCYVSYFLGKINEKLQKHQEASKNYYDCIIQDNTIIDAKIKFQTTQQNHKLKICEIETQKIYQQFTALSNDQNLQTIKKDYLIQAKKVEKETKERKREMKVFKEKLNLKNFKNRQKKLGDNLNIYENQFEEFSQYIDELYKPLQFQTQNKFDQALLLYKNMPCKFKTSPYTLNQIGICYLKMVKYQEAYEYFKKAYDIDKLNLDVIEYYSSCLWHLKKTKELLNLSKEFFKHYPTKSKTWVLMGNTYSALKDHVLAIKFFQRSLKIDSQQSYVYCLLGHEYIFTEDYQQANFYYKKALDVNITEFHGFWGQGYVHLKQENFQNAIHNFQTAQRINPNCPIIYTYLGMSYQNLGELDLALFYFEKAERMDKKSLMNKFYRAQVLFKMGKCEEALKELEQMKNQNKLEPQIYILIGKINDKLGKFDEAHQNYQYALELDPKDQSKKIRTLIDMLNNKEGFNHTLDKENFHTPQSLKHQLKFFYDFIQKKFL